MPMAKKFMKTAGFCLWIRPLNVKIRVCFLVELSQVLNFLYNLR